MGALIKEGPDMARPSTRHGVGNAQTELLCAETIEVLDNPASVRIIFEIPKNFFKLERTKQDRALAAASAELSAITARTVAGWDASVSLLSITLEILAEVSDGPIIGTGSVSRMGTNLVFVGGQITAGDQLCVRTTGSCRFESKSQTNPQPF